MGQGVDFLSHGPVLSRAPRIVGHDEYRWSRPDGHRPERGVGHPSREPCEQLSLHTALRIRIGDSRTNR